MDVRCPRCQSEYELDDARVTDEGVTVKCSECQHVFRVRRKSLMTTPPADDEQVGSVQLPPTATHREWRVRQPNGNTYLCKELTTLQKWIIERKVGRDDEISLTGETWKRLGDIPELASFFQVVEDANKARTYEALRATQVDVPLVSSPAPSIPPGAKIHETWKEPNFAPPMPGLPSPVAPADPLRETMKGPAFSTPLPQAKSPSRPLPRLEAVDEEELAKAVRGGGFKWVVLILGGLVVGGGAGYYFGFYEPEQQAKADALRLAEQKTLEDAARLKAEQEAIAARAKAEADAAAAKERELAALVDAGPADGGVADSGVSIPVDGGATAVTQTVPPPGKSYDFYMERGDALRDNEKYQAALNSYGRAADLKPDRVEPIVGRGFALFDLGQMLQAEASFEQALQVNPRYGPAIMGMAEVLKAQGKKAKALEFYQRYLSEHPNGSEANVAKNAIERLK
jgi:predicted Zn finger-like uncharacterized protein